MISDVKMRRKQVFQKRMETAQQENERLRHENQSHMATISHFESEVRNTLYQ